MVIGHMNALPRILKVMKVMIIIAAFAASLYSNFVHGYRAFTPITNQVRWRSQSKLRCRYCRSLLSSLRDSDFSTATFRLTSSHFDPAIIHQYLDHPNNSYTSIIQENDVGIDHMGEQTSPPTESSKLLSGYARTGLEHHSLSCIDFPIFLSHLSQELQTIPGLYHVNSSFYDSATAVQHAYRHMSLLSTHFPMLPKLHRYTLYETLLKIEHNSSPSTRKELFEASQNIDQIEELHRFFSQLITSDAFHREDKVTFIQPWVGALQIPLALSEIFKDAFIKDSSTTNYYDTNRIYLLNPEKYPTIRHLNKEFESIESSIFSTLNSLASRSEIRSRLSLNSDNSVKNIITIVNGHYCLPIVPSYKRGLGIVHGESNSGKTVYIEPHAVVELTDALHETEKQLKREESRIFFEMVRALAQHKHILQQALAVIGDLDIMRAKYQFVKYKMHSLPVIPEVGDEGIIHVFQARHPLLLLRAHLSSPTAIKDVVPTPLLSLSQEGYSGLIISGPNAGGKTLVLKTIGLFVMMVRYAIPLPMPMSTATSSHRHDPRVDYFTNVLADIGDSQSVNDDQSTFSGHLLTIKDILNTVQQHHSTSDLTAPASSLVLLDEIGSGTDPEQGASLAQAVLEGLIQLPHCRVLVTTHLPQIKNLASSISINSNNTLKNYDINNSNNKNMRPRFLIAGMEILWNKPTYRLCLGVPGESFALSLAERLQLPDSVIARAAELLDESTTTKNGSVLTLQTRLQQALDDVAEKAQALEKEKQNLLIETQKLVEAKDAFDKEIEEIRASQYLRYLLDLKDKEKRLNEFYHASDMYVAQQKQLWHEIQRLKSQYQQLLKLHQHQLNNNSMSSNFDSSAMVEGVRVKTVETQYDTLLTQFQQQSFVTPNIIAQETLAAERRRLEVSQAARDIVTLQCVPIPTDMILEEGTKVVILDRGNVLYGETAYVSQRHSGAARGRRVLVRVPGRELKLPRHMLALPKDSIFLIHNSLTDATSPQSAGRSSNIVVEENHRLSRINIDIDKRSSLNTIDVREETILKDYIENNNAHSQLVTLSLQKIVRYINNHVLDQMLQNNDARSVYVYHGKNHPAKNTLRQQLTILDIEGVQKKVFWPVRSRDGGEECTLLLLRLQL